MPQGIARVVFFYDCGVRLGRAFGAYQCIGTGLHAGICPAGNGRQHGAAVAGALLGLGQRQGDAQHIGQNFAPERAFGTAAAEGWPAVFCRCKYCLEAQRLGGKNIRTRSQAIVNDDLLLDLPPDTYMHKLMNHLDLSRVKYLFVTHFHMDHFYPQELTVRGSVYSLEMISPELEIYCAQETYDYFRRCADWEIDEKSDSAMHWHILKPFEPVELLARIEVVLRRAGKSEMHLRYGDIQVDIEKHTALKNGMPVALTPKEFDVLVFFMRNPDVAITREQLLSNIWGFDFTGESRSVDIHVQQVRRKMGLQGKLITIPKLGYRLERR